MTTKTLSQLQNAIREMDRPYIGLTDGELLNEIANQEDVVTDCIFFAKRVAADPNPDSIEPLEGLYFSFDRYRELTNELSARLK